MLGLVRLRLDEATKFLFQPKYSVNMVDFGPRMRNGVYDWDNLVIRCHVTRKLSLDELAALGITPVDQKFGEFDVDVIEGSYSAAPVWGGSPPPPLEPWNTRCDPLHGGTSISATFSSGAGTLGAIVRDRTNGRPMILSNWHVLAKDAGRGQPIVNPGRLDRWPAPATIAAYDRHAMDSYLDAAVAYVGEDVAWRNFQGGYGPVRGVAQPWLGQEVVKSGRTSHLTHGIVTGIGGLIKMSYRSRSSRRPLTYTLRTVVAIDQRWPGSQLSMGGDSGSLYIIEQTGEAIALHFAGMDHPERALAVRLTAVQDALGVDVVSDLASLQPAGATPAFARNGVLAGA
jgi:endonuclease G